MIKDEVKQNYIYSIIQSYVNTKFYVEYNILHSYSIEIDFKISSQILIL